MTINEQLQSITENALRRGVLFFAIFAIPTAVASLSRGIRGEWQPVFTLQLLTLSVLLVTAVMRDRLTSKVLGGIVVTLCSLVALGGLYTYGTMAAAGHWFLALAILIIGMLYSSRGVVVGAATLFVGALLIAGLHLGGYATPVIVPAQFAVATGSWLVELLCALLFIFIVLPTVRSFVAASERWMTEFELRHNEIAHLAMHDELTGLPLLRAARDRLAMACRRSRLSGEMIAVMFIDLDGFKQINDNYGHEAGDTCLRAVAQRLRDRLREQDTVARIGGDEFIVVLDCVASEHATEQVASELIELIRQPIDFVEDVLHIGASIGISLCPDNSEQAASLLRGADQAMYRSKQSGKNGFLFAQGTLNADEQALTHMNDLAVTADDTVGTQELTMLQQLSESIISKSIAVLAVIVTLAVVANVWRIISNQAAPNIGPTLVVVLVLSGLVFGRDHIPLQVKIALTSAIGLLIALPGMFVSGLAGPAVGWGCAASLFLAGVFYSWRIGLALATLVVTALLVSGLGFTSGALVHSFDVNQQALHPSTWLVFIMAGVAYGGMVLSAWSQEKKTISRLIDETSVQITELERLATIDELTGLPLLRLANDRLKMSCRRARRSKFRAALMLVDLDGFKAVNDTFGHDAGDHCLRETANRMSRQLHTTDTVARVGGDEFLVIIDTVTEIEQVSDAAERLIREIALPIAFGEGQFEVSATIGIALYPDHGTVGDTLRQRADAAMYEAKELGKNRFHFADPPQQPESVKPASSN